MTMVGEQLMWPRWVQLSAAAFAVLIAVLTATADTHGSANTNLAVLAGLATVPWLVEAVTGRRLPCPVFALGVFLPLALINLAGAQFGITNEDGQVSFMLLTLAVGELAASMPLRRVAPYALVAVLMPLGRFLVEPGFHAWIFWSVGGLLGTGAGLVMQRQHQLFLQLRTAQAALAQEAALEERRRIALEVHDVIAHSMTVSLLHVTAARLAVRRDPAEAEEALADAERLGRQALADIRGTVGLLHDGSSGATAAALPTATDLPALVQSYSTAGLDVQFECDADLSRATPAGGLALYRAVQEGLANAAKHAPGAPVVVGVRLDGDRLVAEVSNPFDGQPPSSATGGLGLRGMRERIEALGGTVKAGPTGNGWVTACSIPVPAAQ
jgi:signal transduction histidine kinase